jgi:hypothetical protein
MPKDKKEENICIPILHGSFFFEAMAGTAGRLYENGGYQQKIPFGTGKNRRSKNAHSIFTRATDFF